MLKLYKFIKDFEDYPVESVNLDAILEYLHSLSDSIVRGIIQEEQGFGDQIATAHTIDRIREFGFSGKSTY